jgi:hypothetical protein
MEVKEGAAMWIGLLWIVGCYGISIALLHLCFGKQQVLKRKAVKVLLITKNNQTQIEWYIRSLFFVSRLRGRELSATILDEGSTDETLKIIERLSHTHHMELEWCGPDQTLDDLLIAYESDPVILVNLGGKEELTKIPLFDH